MILLSITSTGLNFIYVNSYKDSMNTLLRFLLVCMVVLVILLSVSSHFGLFVSVGVGDSMEPTIDSVPSLLVHDRVESIHDVSEGDIVTYYDSEFDTKITHRIIVLDTESDRVVLNGDNTEDSIRQELTVNEFESSVDGKIVYVFDLL